MNEPLTSLKRAERLYDEARELGMDAPNEVMIAGVIQDAEFDTLHNREIISERHGGQPDERDEEIAQLREEIRRHRKQAAWYESVIAELNPKVKHRYV